MLKYATLSVLMCLTNISWAQNELESQLKTEMSARIKFYTTYSKRSNDAGIDLKHVRLYLEPNMNTGTLVKAQADYIFVSKISTDRFELDLRKELTVDSVVYHGQSLAFVHSTSHLLSFDFPASIPANNSDSFKVYYHGLPNMSTRAYFRSANISGSSISTLSQPYGAHYWWPCRENLIDKIDSLDVLLNVDSPYYAVSNGKLLSVKSQGINRTFHYAHRYPIVTYLVAVSFSRYVKYSDTMSLQNGKELEIIHHVFPHNDNMDNRKRTDATMPMMRLMDSLFGEYPFVKEHYGHAQFAWSGGMEHQTMSFMANFNYDLVAHELGHQWFGDMVTCGTWKDLWLNEGFATYSNYLCYEFLKSKDEFRNKINVSKSEVLSVEDGSVYVYDTASVSVLFDSRTTYEKGALILHQLRWLVGDTAFFDGIRQYLQDPDVKYGFARQDKLKFHLEQTSGMELDKYFQDWVLAEGYPIYDIQWVQKGKKLEFLIAQQVSDASVSYFDVPIPVRIYGANGVKDIRVPITGLQSVFSADVDFKVIDMEIDPDEWILAKYTLNFPLPDGHTISLYPNPFNGILYFSASEFEVESYSLADATGKIIVTRTFETSVAKGGIGEIDAQALADGVYFLTLKGNQEIVVRKIIKQ